MPYMLKKINGEYLIEDWMHNQETSFTTDKRFACVFDSMLQANKTSKSYFGRELTPEFTTRQNNLVYRKRFVSLREFTV